MRFSDIGNKYCSPISVLESNCQKGSFIGGVPPRGVVPHYKNGRQKFFGTVGFEEFSVSIFYSFEVFGFSETHDLMDFNNRPLFNSDMIHAVVHSPMERDVSSSVIPELSPHMLHIEQPILDDLVLDKEMCIHPGMKIGGKPFVDNKPLVGDAFLDLEKLGFKQMAQFDTPSPIDQPYIQNYPWDPGWLHMFYGNTGEGRLTFAFIVQQ